ncbi:hypothetical protein, partial [Nostoc sp. JL23]|uniref:hypothetical protein n=1 Tax=Nostoc sp. JL23 TaxID=2815394 RepID=UPI0025F721EB
ENIFLVFLGIIYSLEVPNSVLDNIKSSNVTRSQQLSGKEEVFVIDVGKPVQIFVNQTISL